MKRTRHDDGPPPWGALPTELVQDVCFFLATADLASASLICRAWRAAACALVTHLTLPLNHPLLIAGPACGWEECAARMFPPQAASRPQQHTLTATDPNGRANGAGGSGGASYGVNGGASSSSSSGGAPSVAVDSGQLNTAGGDTIATPIPGGGRSPFSGSERHEAMQVPPGAAAPAGASGPSYTRPQTPACTAGASAGAGAAVAAATPPAAPTLRAAMPPLPRLRTDFPLVTHITLVHNAMLHRSQVHAALSTVRALWPAVQGLSVHDSVTWDLPLDYSALGVMTHITSLELLFQGQGGMDEAGQPMYRASMPHLCKLSQLKELCMKWIIGYDVDSFLDFNEVYDLLASLVRHSQLRSLQFGGENINAEGARHLASITTLETLNLVCDARPASPVHLLDLLTMPRLTRLELMHVCPDHAWNAPLGPGEQPPDALAELARRAPALSASPLRCLALSLSPGCQAMVSRALPLLRHLHSLSVRVTSTDEEEALCAAFKSMREGTAAQWQQQQQPSGAAAGAAAGGGVVLPPAQEQQPAGAQPGVGHGLAFARSRLRSGLGSPAAAAAAGAASTPGSTAEAQGQSLQGPHGPSLRSLRLETAELGAELIAALASLTSLTSLQLPRGLPTGEVVEYTPAAAAAAVAEADVQPAVLTKYSMAHLSSLGRLTCLRRLMVQLDSPADTAPAFVDGSMVSVLSGLPHLESLHLSTWNLLGLDPTPEAVGPFPGPPDPTLLTPLTTAQQPQQHRQPHAGAAGGATSKPEPPKAEQTGSVSGQTGASPCGGSGGDCWDGAEGPRRRQGARSPCMAPLPTRSWQGLRSLSLTHWPGVYGKLREIGPPQPGRCYAVCWDDLPRCLEALLLVRCQLAGSRPPPALRHLWLADCISGDIPLPQLLAGMTGLETLVLRWPSSQEEQEPQGEAAARHRAQLVAAVTSLQGLRTLGLGGIRCADVPSLSPLSLLRHLMLEPMQPARPAGEPPSAQRDLTLLDALMTLPAGPGGLAGLRTLWLPNWAMPIKQLLQWQQILQAAMPLVVLRVTEYDVVWTVPTPVMHVARVEAPSSLVGRAGRPFPSPAGSGGAGGGGAGGGGAGGGGGGFFDSATSATSERRGALWRGGGRSGQQRLHAGAGLDGQELEWWHIGCWTVQ